MPLPRNLTQSDIPSAMELSTVAKWNQTAEDWERLLRLAPHGCRCIEKDGRIAATASRVTYAGRLGWIGMVLTRPEDRRRGFARQLLEDALQAAERDEIRTLKLDATDAGRPLYEKLGFVVEECVERWERPILPNIGSSHPATTEWSTDVLPLDIAAFGISREDLLRDLGLTGECAISSTAFVHSRTGRVARYLGPCVAASGSEARKLIGLHLDAKSQWFWDILPSNADAVACAREFGFAPSRILWRMRRGEPIESNNSFVYAIAGFELG